MNMPKTFDFGGGDLVEVSYLEQVFGIKRRTALKYLDALRIKPLYVGKQVYFSLPTFKRILFVLSRPGGKGFVFPGSNQKNNPRVVGNDSFTVKVSDEILAEAAKPEVMAEMCACSGRNDTIIKQFITKSPGRPKMEKHEQSS